MQKKTVGTNHTRFMGVKFHNNSAHNETPQLVPLSSGGTRPMRRGSQKPVSALKTGLSGQMVLGMICWSSSEYVSPSRYSIFECSIAFCTNPISLAALL